MTTSELINEVAAACAKAQVELKPALKDATNPAFRSKYADHAAIVEASRVYAKHGVAVFQDVTTSEAGASVETRLAHISGQWIQFGPLTIPMAKRDAHGAGSATTYAKRYALSAALGISADEDDDGNAASESTASRPVAVRGVPNVPPGYDDWLTDLEAVADEGSAALKSAWEKSQPSLRKHLTDTQNAKWEALKKRAAMVKTAVTA
jgi:hypothetical protein